MPGLQFPLQFLNPFDLRKMADQTNGSNNAINAIGTVLGYIGAEAATTASLNRLLWPQRANLDLRISHLAKLAIFLPSGGPLYKGVLGALDRFNANGLFQGKHRGHMLGSPFFPDTGCEYTLHGNDQDRWPTPSEPSRNNLWMRVMALMPFTPMVHKPLDAEKALESTPLRARVAVRHLTLGVKSGSKHAGKRYPCYRDIGAECRTSSFKTVFGVLTTEATGLATAAVVASVWKSWLAVLWALPFALKTLAILTAVEREPLDLTHASLVAEEPQNFEIHMPAETGTFLVISGPPTLVLQFFRHYGHPKRDRLREVIQLATVIALGCVFPLSLLCSVAWMPLPVQYVWLSYQMYVVGSMYIARFLDVESWASTEEGIAKLLTESVENGPVYLWTDRAIDRVVEARLESTFFARYGEGKAHLQSPLQDPPTSKEITKSPRAESS